jgi:hypothetical protein
MKTKIDIIELKRVVAESISIGQVLLKLNLPKSGSRYESIKKLFTDNSIDISHFSSQSWSKGKILLHGRTIDDYLSNEIKINSNLLKKYLIKLDIKEKKCEKCNLVKWLEKDIPLELHHIDGNHLNNNLVNIQILCPNCHSLTDNYRKKK